MEFNVVSFKLFESPEGGDQPKHVAAGQGTIYIYIYILV
jgi:hypothetical protein